MLRVIIDDVVSNYSTRLSSHKAGWPRMQRCLIQDALTAEGRDAVCELASAADPEAAMEADIWAVSHPMEFNGEGFNLFGGWTEKTAERVQRLARSTGELISLERPMPDYAQLLKPRAAKTLVDLDHAQWSRIDERRRKSRIVTHADLLKQAGGVEPEVVLGDSHSIAHYTRGRLVLRHDGLTLHGLLKRGLWRTLQDAGTTHCIPELTICAGNIDIRHHLLRLENPSRGLTDVLDELELQLTELRRLGIVDSFTVVAPLPIEHEERKIPGTGFYRGTPFYGSLEARADLVDQMRIALRARFGADRVFSWPDSWYLLHPADYAARHMEKPGSVHLSPEWHRWDYVANEPNARLEEQ